jgi:hypothetical protein
MHGARSETRGLVPLFVVVLVAVVLAVISSGCGVWDDDSPSGGGDHLDQVSLQSAIVNDRKQLFNGVLTYGRGMTMSVEDTRQYRVDLTAVGERGDTAGVPDGSRSLQVGGVEEAKLSVVGEADRVDISPVGSTRGLIGRPGDKLGWTWDITPKEPGDYTLRLVVITYQGNTDNPLSTMSPPVEIKINVSSTWSYRAKAMGEKIAEAGALIGAIGVIGGFFWGVSKRLKRRRQRERA